MSRAASEPRARWWQRRGPSFLVFCVVILAMVGVSALLWNRATDVLPTVGESQQGDDPWLDPIGVEEVGPFQVAHIPDCAAAPVVRIGLWDEESTPYWEISGPPTPMSSFAVGALPNGFTEETPYREPPADAVLRLVVIRKLKGVAGVRYQAGDLREGYAAYGLPIRRATLEAFQTGEVCGGEDGSGTTTTTATG